MKIEDDYGNIYYIVNKQIHREDGPAYISWSGRKDWFVWDKRHRIDGPAITCKKSNLNSWYINNVEFLTKEEWFAALTPKQKENYIWNLNE